jgi:hypothetical protein
VKYEEFTKILGESFPELEIADPDLPHVELGALLTLLRTVASNKGWDATLVQRVVDFLERASSSEDERVRDLVTVSFLENLGLLGERCSELVRVFGPRTSALATEFERRWGSICG